MSKSQKLPKPPPAGKPRPPPDKDEQRAVAAARARLADRLPRLTTQLDTDEKGSITNIGPEHSDRDGWLARFEDLFGTNGRSFPIAQLNHILAVSRNGESYDKGKVNALLAAVEGAAPADELQAMLAVQLAVTHEMAMQAVRRAMRVDQIPQYDSAGNMAVKLLRTFTAQAEALAKLQRGGEQVVKVVHVHPGAQAVVGNVIAGTSDAGGGGHLENRNQPHAKAELPAPAAAAMPPLRREDKEREPLPLAQRGR